jgi:hypothetical protein
VGGRIDCRTLITSGYLVNEELELPRFEHLERAAAEGWAADVFARRA